MSQPDVQKIAEKIASLLAAENHSSDLAGLYAAIEKIDHRLDKLEKAADQPRSTAVASEHPSMQKFTVEEAIADRIFDGVGKEKACQFEPAKPCDHCSMCNSRGF